MTAAPSLKTRRVLVTGADGFLGRGVVAALAREGVSTLVAADVREVPAERRLPGVIYLVQDVRDPALAQTLADQPSTAWCIWLPSSHRAKDPAVNLNIPWMSWAARMCWPPVWPRG